MTILFAALVLAGGAPALSQSIITPLTNFQATTHEGRIHVLADNAPPSAFLLATVDARVILKLTETPVGGTAILNGVSSQPARSHWISEPQATTPSGALRVFAVAPEYMARLLPAWPHEAELVARVDTLGPGASSAWLSLGSEAGMQAGASFWRRVGGQPIARLDVVFVTGSAGFARVIPLVAPLTLREGDEVYLWPRPGAARAGQAYSAVSQLDDVGARRLAWVAAPRTPRCSEDARVDFFRNGRHVGAGTLEWLGARFWHVRLGGSGEPVEVAIGDDAVIRTDSDARQKAFYAHVFEQSAEGFLIDVGEAEGVTVGETAPVFRDGVSVGQARLRRVQAGYSVIDPVGDTIQLKIGDELHFGEPESRANLIGEIVETFAEGLFRARLTAGATPAGPIAIRSNEAVVGVGLIVYAEGADALGFSPTSSRGGPIEVGQELITE